MTHHCFLSLLNRRGVWMTPFEIFDASPDYPIGDYVLADLQALKANDLIVSRQRSGSSLTEYGLASWIAEKPPMLTLTYLAYCIRRLLGQLLAT
jgi:hypothetical protein